jgi:hypothetical protein
MNSMELIRSACRAWLTVPDQTAMELSELSELLRVLSLAQSEVWRDQPPHYRRQRLSLDFYGAAEGHVTVAGGYSSRVLSGILFPTITDILTFDGEPITFEGEPLLFNGESVYENPRPFCSILLDGDAVANEFNGTNLVHPYLGQATTSIPAILYDDAKLTDVLIERILGPVMDRRTRLVYCYQPTLDYWSPGSIGQVYTTHRVNYLGVERTIFRLLPQHREPVSLSFDAIVAPISLSYGASQRPVDLPYGDEVGGIIVSVAGEALITHPLFARDRINGNEARAAGDRARAQLAKLSPAPTAQPNAYGTRPGF